MTGRERKYHVAKKRCYGFWSRTYKLDESDQSGMIATLPKEVFADPSSPFYITPGDYFKNYAIFIPTGLKNKQ